MVRLRWILRRLAVAAGIILMAYYVVHVFKDKPDLSVQLYNLNESVSDASDCVPLGTTPSPIICLHPPGVDVYVSDAIRARGVWEGHILKAMTAALSDHPQAGLLDIGAHVGLYSLVAASMGCKVVAVEPIRHSLQLFNRAIKLNHFQGEILIIRNAVGDRRRVDHMVLSNTNQGSAHMQTGQVDENTETQTVTTILLDDITPYIPFHQAVMKVDIELHEARAFLHAKQLLSKISVSHIFMEWRLKEFNEARMHFKEDIAIVETMISMLTELSYKPHRIDGSELNTKLWGVWVDDIVWVKEVERHQL